MAAESCHRIDATGVGQDLGGGRTVTGTVNVVNGEFEASGPVTASSGKLAGATGHLILAGTGDLATGAFTETVRGIGCVDLAP